MELREQGFHRFKGACAREFVDDGVVGVVILGKIGVEFSGVEEYLEGKIEVLLTVDHGNEAFWVEALGPGFNWGRDCVVLEEWGGGIHGGKVDGGEVPEYADWMEESNL